MTTSRRVAPSRLFARKALALWPDPADRLAAEYSDFADVARSAFPEPTKFHLAVGLDRYEIVHPWPAQGVILIIEARLMENGTVELVNFVTTDIPDSPADLDP